jgi:hypothetical protein
MKDACEGVWYSSAEDSSSTYRRKYSRNGTENGSVYDVVIGVYIGDGTSLGYIPSTVSSPSLWQADRCCDCQPALCISRVVIVRLAQRQTCPMKIYRLECNKRIGCIGDTNPMICKKKCIPIRIVMRACCCPRNCYNTVWTPTLCKPDTSDRPYYFPFNLLNLATPLTTYAVHLVLLILVPLSSLLCYLYDAILILTFTDPC